MKKKNPTQFGLLLGLFMLTIVVSGSVINPVQAQSKHPEGSVIRGERPPIDIATVPDEAMEQGIIRIKFNRTLENLLDNGMISSNPDGTIRFGIAGIDQLNQQFGVSEVKKTFDAALQNTKYTERHRLWGFHLWYDLKVPDGTDIRSMVMAYSAKNEIQLSEPVYRKQLIGADINPLQSSSPAGGDAGLSYVPNDPRYNEQWHYHNTGQQSGTVDADIDLPEAWDITRGNTNVVVAVVDGGIDYTHADLAANMWPGIGYNFVTNSPVVTAQAHGTHVAGTVAANTNNAVGVSGVAGGDGSGNGVRLMSCQVFTDGGAGGFENAPVWAADNGAAISQNSWTYTSVGSYDQAVLDAIDYFNINGGGTVMNGGITIFAAANYDSQGQYYPAYYSGSFSVAATGNQDLKAWYSNYGTWVEISAPGGETDVVSERGVLSTLPGNTYGFYQGTSMACPHASGVAALILSIAPGVLTPQNVKDILISTTDDIDGLNPTYAGLLGSGRLNAYQALLETQNYMTPTANFSASPTTICAGGSVTFTNLSFGGPTSWSWSFPGGTPSSYVGENPPAITYPTAGSYSVTLTVTDGVTPDTETKTGYINVQNVIAGFTGAPLSIFEGGSVTFTDNSSCSPTSWAWSFPGGSPASFSGQNPPAVTYAASGTYDVTLVVSKPGATDTETKSAYITVAPPVFNMTNGSATTCAGSFYDSGGPSGNYTNNQNFTFTFYPGTPGALIRAVFSAFSVESGYDFLRIYNGINTSAPLIGTYTGATSPGTVTANNGSGALTFNFTSDYIVTASGWAAAISCFSEALSPVAEFTASSNTPIVNETVNFTDQSTNVPTAWAWSFSPNNVVFMNGTSAGSQNPEVQFTAAGLYTVALTASNAGGPDTEIKTDYINVVPFAYCIPTYSSGTGSGDYISLVQLGSINNTTGGSSSPYYTYYNSLSTDLSTGTEYTITLSAGTYGSGNNISVWIDFNQNGVFDANEKLGNVNLLSTPATGTISFTVPGNALPGTTRMRVREVWAESDMDPCSSYGFGETEDYNVNILPIEYCYPTYIEGTSDGDYISLVQLGSINNATGPSDSPFYTYYNGVSTSLNAGSEYTVTLSAGTYEENNNISVWIDFNYDGIFDGSEKLGNVTLPAAPVTGTITFTVPAGTLSGTTRMRVREVYNITDIDPCDAVSYYYGETEDYDVHIENSDKILNLTLFLQGFFNGIDMNQAQDVDPDENPFNKFSGTTVDSLSVYLADANAPWSFLYGVNGAFINTDGTLSVMVPSAFSEAYYIAVKHHSSVETWSSAPVDFSGSYIYYNFTTSAGQAYGSNQKSLTDGSVWGLYSGDVNQDGYIEFPDVVSIYNLNVNSSSGYLQEDLDGNGFIEFLDYIIAYNNSVYSVGMITPVNPAKRPVAGSPEPTE
ncbi:MAG: GEVED domain-containing protein [Lentimicrobium sp.]